MDHPFKSPVILSLCTGMRGLETGIERALNALWLERQTVTVAAYSDIEAFICYNLIEQMQQGVLAPAPVWTDLKTFPAPFFHNKVHGIIGGYPCQPFSLAGNLGGEADPRHLWPYIKNPIIPGVNPVWCFFENVANHLNIGYETVRGDLQDMGYHVEEGIFSAEEVGAPHRRERLFILAVDHSRCNGFEQINEIYAGQTMADTSYELHNGSGNVGQGGRGEHTDSGDELANANDHGLYGSENTESNRKRNDGNKTRQVRIFQSQGCGGSRNNETVADTNGESNPQRESICRYDEPEQQAAARSGYFWPAGQGEYQHPWEEPRTVKPGLGCTVNGYNFRNDLLRMYGNGVVEQTAALAFLTLLQKHANAQRQL